MSELEKAAEHSSIRARTVRVWYVVMMGFVGMAIGLAIAYAFIVQQGKDSRRATCAVIQANRDVYRETPPTTEVGRNAERAWNDLFKTLGCKEIPTP